MKALFHTARLTLSPIAKTDLEDLWPHTSNPELPRHMTWAAHSERAQTLAFIEQSMRLGDQGTAVVWVLREHGEFRGVVGLHDIQRQHLAWQLDKAELGYWVVPAAHGKGFATEAARALLKHGFETLALHKIEVHTVDENKASVSVIEKLGFRFVGEQRQHLNRHGRWWNLLAYELLADDWKKP
ncbi:MAG: GNAT family N-acetyltransferase [Myxococcaceae bacterium]|nr:GNAT family N-acetyltransferase [Myxococcaceae bacterium]